MEETDQPIVVLMACWPTPNPGDIVECRFPHDKVPGPGPKERPALVTKVEIFKNDEGEMRVVVEVAYGTSQNAENVYPGEFVIKAHYPGSGLTKDTKFDLGKAYRLDFDDQWFAPATPPHPNVPPKRGALDPNRDQTVKRKLASAHAEAKKRARLRTRIS